MKRVFLAVVGLLSVAVAAEAQTPEIERALLASPARARDGAAVIRWNADFTYATLKEGSGTLVCYDHSGAAGEAPFSIQCTHPGNLPRVAQNYRFEAQANGDRQAVSALVAEAEANGTREQAVYGSPWIGLTGPDQASARLHMTIAMPGATTESSGFPDNGRQGGAWIMGAGTGGAHLMIPG